MNRTALRLLLLSSSVFVSARVSAQQPFQNGSFELGSPGPGPCFATVPAGDTRISGWTVIDGDIDWYGPSCSILPSNGLNSLDLVGDQTIGGIQQTFDTNPGQTYTISFDLNGNYGALPVIKPLTVTIGADVHTYTFDTTGESAANFLSRYQTQTIEYVATGPSTTISFVSDTTGQGFNAGAVIDNVRFGGAAPASAVPALSPALLAALAAALALAGGVLARRQSA